MQEALGHAFRFAAADAEQALDCQLHIIRGLIVRALLATGGAIAVVLARAAVASILTGAIIAGRGAAGVAAVGVPRGCRSPFTA